jgi:hypothetical protein
VHQWNVEQQENEGRAVNPTIRYIYTYTNPIFISEITEILFSSVISGLYIENNT